MKRCVWCSQSSDYAAAVSRQMLGVLIAASALRAAGHLHGVVWRD